MGTLVSSPFVGMDEFGREGCFFCFPDLSCQTTGRYRLKFNLLCIDPTNMGRGSKRVFEASVISDVFQVYTKDGFPGMRSSSALVRRLKESGCLNHVKKGIERVKEHGKREEESGDLKVEEDMTTEELAAQAVKSRGIAESREVGRNELESSKDRFWTGGSSREIPAGLQKTGAGGEGNKDKGKGKERERGDDDDPEDPSGTDIGEPRYELNIRQQPVAARAFDFNDQNKSPIDPPPILELKMTDPNTSAEVIRARLRSPFNSVHGSLCPADEQREARLDHGQERLEGTLTTSPEVDSSSSVEECFFYFPDLYIKTPG